MIRALAAIVAIFAALAPVGLMAQAARGIYTYERTTTGSSEVVTLHLPAGSSRTARLLGVTVYAATATTATATRDGTAPTATAATATKLNANYNAAAVIPYYSSNVGSSTHIKTYNIAATEEKIIDFTNKGMVAGENLSITPALSGARVFFMWQEF